MVSSLWPPVVLGGAERYAAALAARLRGAGCEVGVLTFGVVDDDVVATVRPWPYRLDAFEHQSAARRVVFHALDVHRPGVRSTFDAAVEEFEPDVVHSHSVAGLSTAILTAPHRRGIPHVHTLHDYWLLCRRSSLVGRGGDRCVTRCASCAALSRVRELAIGRHPPDVVLAVSRAVMSAHADLDWIGGRLRIVRNPVDPVVSSDVVPGRSVRSGSTPIAFGYLGRLTQEKGVRTLVDAFAGVGGNDPVRRLHGRLLLGGEGPLGGAIEERAVSGVQLLGWLDSDGKDRFFREIDCLVVPSEWDDPAPLVIDEARSRRVPVIGARTGGIPELIAPSCEPLLFESGDAAALGESLDRFAASPGDFADDGSGITTWDEHLAQVDEAYDDAIAAR